ncbi:MAG: argininosuccinate lyase [Acidobacteriia bacterium]|nr:argininosuccinate lyase [Terriglobia bacterium]
MKLWGGRFSPGKRDPDFERFSESFSVDQRLVLYDLRVNRAYVRALGAARVLSAREVRALTRGLDAIRRYVESHPNWARGESAEDVHTWVEARLEREVGAVARKLRTGRSRNDLVATETRLFLKSEISNLLSAVSELLEALLAQARKNPRAILPGFTHLQPAQAILFGHYLLAYFEMLWRDVGRLEDCRVRANELPMGAGALAGTAYRLDRARLAKELGFARVARNSLDVTSDRDFVCEFLFACAMIMTHLSRLAEDLVIYSTPNFGFVELSDAYATGSSLMPQKKNPDSLELIRGKAARVLGRLTASVALLKGLPLAYNRDLQEDKAGLFDAVDTTRDSLIIAARVVRTMNIHPDRMKAATARGFLTATDVADELVRRGLPFAEAHEQVGRLVRHCDERGVTFAEIADREARQIIPAWGVRLRAVAVSPELSVRRRDVLGGTAPAQVSRQLRAAERRLRALRRPTR